MVLYISTQREGKNKKTNIAGWSSSVARRAHNPKVVGSNPAPATIIKALIQSNQGFFRAFQNFEKTSGKRRACLRVGYVEPKEELRNCDGDKPTRLVNALVKVVTSWYPTSCEIFLIGISVVFNKCLARFKRI